MTELERFAAAMLAAMSPVDRFVAITAMCDHKHHWHAHYIEWRMRRQAKLLELLGADLKGCRILELGGGTGDIGGFLADVGAEVLAIEGRQQNVAMARLRNRNVPTYRAETWDLEKDFRHFGRFDVIVNFGLIEVIEQFRDVIGWSTEMSDRIILETLVCDSENPRRVRYTQHDKIGGDDPLRGTGCRLSPAFIEALHEAHGFTVTRHFTSDLNAGPHCYDWAHQNDDRVIDRERKLYLRRFWDFRR